MIGHHARVALGQVHEARTESVEQLAASSDELVAPRPGTHQLHGGADQLADPLDVVSALLREVFPAAG